mgnify:CR=1 FL=1
MTGRELAAPAPWRAACAAGGAKAAVAVKPFASHSADEGSHGERQNGAVHARGGRSRGDRNASAIENRCERKCPERKSESEEHNVKN